MHFCSNCNNMYYIRINSENTNKLVYYCRNCGNEDTLLTTDNVCVSKTTLKKSDNIIFLLLFVTVITYCKIINKYFKI